MENVYNFEVEGFHTYHIGELGVWVHNTNCDELFDIIADSGMSRQAFDKALSIWDTTGTKTLAETVIEHANKAGMHTGPEIAKYMRQSENIISQIRSKARGWKPGKWTNDVNMTTGEAFRTRVYKGPNNAFATVDNNGLLRSWRYNQ